MTEQHTNPIAGKELSNAKKALLERRLRGNLKQVAKAETIPVRQNTQPVPLSFSQERVWFICQLDPQSPAYNMYNVIHLQGKLDRTVLVKSLKALINRHQILRTRFVIYNGQPCQQIVSDFDFDIPLTGLQSLSKNERETRAKELIDSEIRHPFDLSKCPLLRALLLKQGDDEYILILTIHHIIFDEWSNELLWQELSMLYRTFLNNQTPALPDLPVQYADFTLWQKQQVNKKLESQLAYWKKQLDVDFSLLRLPTDYPRPAQQSFRGAQTWLDLPDHLYSQVKTLNQAYGTTTFMTLLAVFQLLLYRYSGQTDILVGTPIANRSHSSTKNLIGLFLNTLVMRANFEDNPRFEDFLIRIRQTALDGYAHQDLPFEKLVEELHPKRDTSHNPIFQVMFVHEKSAVEEINLPDLTARTLLVDSGVAKFDLTLFVQESDQGLSISLEYDAYLFSPDTADRILGHFYTLLESIVNNPGERVSDLQLISDAEQETLLHKWNDTRVDLPQPPQIQQYIEQHAVQNPKTVAVIDNNGQLTYGELDRRANQLAHYLQSLGVGANTPVGLILERSTDMMVAILGVLKAGGAYLPLDPAYPRERLGFILSDTEAPVIVTHQKLAGLLPEYKAKTVFIDSDWDKIAWEDNTSPHIAAAPENLAYIIYTSGSTGQPKGVPISHRNLVHSTSARIEYYPESLNSFILLSSFTFDSSIVGIFGTLCQGGTLILPPQGGEQDIRLIARLIFKHQASHLLSLPSLYDLILSHTPKKQLQSLQAVIVAGEVCSHSLCLYHYNHLPNTTLYNEYGPTEATVWSTVYRVSPENIPTRIPIGRSIPNVQLYILDANLQPVPIGVSGELYIGGDGVASGYLNQPELTVKRFVTNPFLSDTRLYRTGDRVRYLPDGNIEFLGRADNQVKIRGYRIEPGEIETVLAGHSKVQKCAVIVWDGKNRSIESDSVSTVNRKLIAYVQLKDEISTTKDNLRAFLLEKLPEYMVPFAFILLDTMPQTTSGKIDKNKLPEPDSAAQLSGQRFIAPQTKVEQTLAEIWADILEIDRVGTSDNFFELGGNSILALQLLIKTENVFEEKVPLDMLLQRPTIKHLATIFEKPIDPLVWSPLVAIQPHGDRLPFYCIHEISGEVIGMQKLARYLGPDQPFYGLRARGLDGKEEPNHTIEKMAADYIEHMQAIQPNGPYCVGGLSYGSAVALEIAQQLLAQGQQVGLLAILDHIAPLADVNSRGSQFQTMGQILQNLPKWLPTFVKRGPTEMVARTNRKITRNGRLTLARLGLLSTDRAKLRPADIYDYEQKLPEDRRKIIDIHHEAISQYKPKPYAGKVTLFKARIQSLLDTRDLEGSWQELAPGRVAVIDIPGMHENWYREPYVQEAARIIRECLNQVNQYNP